MIVSNEYYGPLEYRIAIRYIPRTGWHRHMHLRDGSLVFLSELEEDIRCRRDWAADQQNQTMHDEESALLIAALLSRAATEPNTFTRGQIIRLADDIRRNGEYRRGEHIPRWESSRRRGAVRYQSWDPPWTSESSSFGGS